MWYGFFFSSATSSNEALSVILRWHMGKILCLQKVSKTVIFILPKRS